MRREGFEALLATLKKAAVALHEDGVPFLLGGGVACWVRGGPESDHDLDLMVKEEDADQALEALERRGFRTEKPPEGWLYKAWDDGVLVDLIFHPTGMPITDEVIERGEELEVEALPMRVMTLEDVFVTKLLALDERSLDYAPALEMARPVREQVDWADVRRRTAESPFAKAFFTLIEELGIVTPRPAGT
jgi:predicted nucleotidyltransferase